MPEPPGNSSLERSKPAEGGAAPLDASPSPGGDRTGKPRWWVMPNFSYLIVWWVALIGYYVAFSSIPGREHPGLIDPEMIYDGWYAILASGLIGAFYAKRFRLLWFLLSIALAALILLLMLLGLGALRNLMNS